MSAYVPKPIDTSKVKLSPQQRQLVDLLSANVHEVWAKKRIEDGWQYGPERNDKLKTHPCLVPYEELVDSEKDYDRVVVEQVVRAALVLGYRIER